MVERAEPIDNVCLGKWRFQKGAFSTIEAAASLSIWFWIDSSKFGSALRRLFSGMIRGMPDKP